MFVKRISQENAKMVPRGPVTLMTRVYRYVLPEVKSQLDGWQLEAQHIPDPELRKQALDSIAAKKFHCQGGAVYAAAHVSMRHVLIPLIVAFQTISDYLDNLCDRSTSLDAEDFRMLHQSMLDAVDPAAPLRDYYEFREEKEDGGYLTNLVKTCQSCILMLPSYELVASPIRKLVTLYGDLQVYKHISRDLREDELTAWWDKHKEEYPEINWNEFAAATGSTLGVFMLFLSASYRQLESNEVDAIVQSYFPYLCGLHILLDYLIDQEEDRIGGDLNFCSYYNSAEQTSDRIAFMAEQARCEILQLESPSFHRMIIEGLLAVYLSDIKVKKQAVVRHISKRLMQKSPMTRLFFVLNSVLVRSH
jgi:tetraprenyl-beta-curcumene synthase